MSEVLNGELGLSARNTPITLVSEYADFAFFFFVGAWISRYALRWAPPEARLPQWLGRISYPSNICHQPLLVFSGLPLWPRCRRR